MTVCHLCEAPLDRAPIVGEKARGGHDSCRVCCSNCGLVQVCPQPSEEELDAYYREGYREEYRTETSIAITDEHGRRRVYDPKDANYKEALEKTAEFQAAKVLSLGLPEGSRVLEVGCGEGRALAAMQEARLSVTGIEPGEQAAGRAMERGGCIFNERWQDCNEGNFDLVCAFHVLEHVHEPLAFLAWCRERLRPGGRVLFEVPNVETPSGPLDESYWQHVHLFDFNVYTLGALMVRAGFDEIRSYKSGAALVTVGTHGDSQPRPYEPHQGPSGESVALWLRCYRERMRPRAMTDGELADRFLKGEALTDEELDRVRAEWLEERTEAADMQRCWEDLHHTIAEYAQQAERLGYASFDAWMADDQIRGQMWGEGYGWTRAAMLLTTIHAAMERAGLGYPVRRGK